MLLAALMGVALVASVQAFGSGPAYGNYYSDDEDFERQLAFQRRMSRQHRGRNYYGSEEEEAARQQAYEQEMEEARQLQEHLQAQQLAQQMPLEAVKQEAAAQAAANQAMAQQASCSDIVLDQLISATSFCWAFTYSVLSCELHGSTS